MRVAADLSAAYRSETEQLTAERIPQAVGAFLLCAGGFGIFDCFLYPAALYPVLAVYGVSAVLALPAVLLRRGLRRRRLMVRASIATGLMLSVLPHVQTVWVGLPTELMGIATVCMGTAMSLVMPWGPRGQVIVSAGNLIGYAVSLDVNGATSTAPVFLLFAVSTGVVVSILGAYYLDLHRLAIFREATQSENEAALNRTLVAIAKEINVVLDSRNVLDRIAGSTRAALACDWSLLLLWDEQRNAFRVAGGAGHDTETFGELDLFEFAPNAFPLIDRILADGYVEIARPTEADPVTAGLMGRWRTHCLLAATLTRSGQVVGILAAGGRYIRGSFSGRVQDLFRGIAEHAAIALNNVRLVADLRQANRLKSEFVSAMSHELRTPMNVILGYTELLIDDTFGRLQDEQREILGRVRQSAGSLLDLINETLDVSRLEAGRAPVHLKEVNVEALLDDMHHEMEELPRKPGVTLRWQAQPGAARILTDPGKLKVVLKNLVGNALKFTDSGEVAVRIGYNHPAACLDISVADTGSGIAADDLPSIFDMFRQVGNGRDLGGVGLGLYILKRFVEQLGGAVSVISTPGEGSTFTVSVPAALAPLAAVSIAEPPRAVLQHRNKRLRPQARASQVSTASAVR